MNKQDFRLFINNITKDIDDSALKEKLTQYGSVTSVEIKERKNIIGNQTPAFAFININTTQENLQKCFKDFSSNKFHNIFIDISVAKENFLERLKRERENNEQKHNPPKLPTKILENAEQKDGNISKPALQTTNNPSIRLIVNNVTKDIDDKALKDKLSQYGSVNSVEIKQRKNIIGNQTPAFALIDVNITQENLQKCFKDFSSNKFHNVFIDISVAKENFLERIKKKEDSSLKFTDPAIKKPEENFSLNFRNTLIKKPEENLSLKFKNTPTHISFIGKTEKFNNSKLEEKDNKVDSNLENSQIQNGEIKKIKKPLSISEEKRLNSILQRKKEYNLKKLAVKNALSSIDVKSSKKIVFRDNDDSNEIFSNDQSKNKDSSVNFQLFDDGDDNDINDLHLEDKAHFNDARGQKLLKLQSKFKNDKRFAMDEKFLENDSSDDDSRKNGESDVTQLENFSEDEKNEQLRILNEVLGNKITTTKKLESSASGMYRYDPDKADHSKYEITTRKEDKKLKRKRENDNNEIDQNVNEKEVEVSKEKFYKVNNDLKNALRHPDNQQFSLLGAYAENNENLESENITAVTSTQKNLKNQLISEKNPFHYDSSSSDSEDDKEIQSQTNNKEVNDVIRRPTEYFFFQYDDYRLQEGLDFVKRLETEEPIDFPKLRRDIREVTKAKVKNIQRKNKQFKKKLGGKKRIKMKRALKR